MATFEAVAHSPLGCANQRDQDRRGNLSQPRRLALVAVLVDLQRVVYFGRFVISMPCSFSKRR
jgi:hypothetical protein